MNTDTKFSALALLGAGFVGLTTGFVLSRLTSSSGARNPTQGLTPLGQSRVGEPSNADLVARQQRAVRELDARVLDIEKIYNRSLLAGKRVLVTGGNRGIGLALVKELVACKAEVWVTVRKSSTALNSAGAYRILEGIDVTSDSDIKKLQTALKGVTLDVLVNNAGYFKSEKETILNDTMDFADEVKTIDICAVGCLRVTNAAYRAGALTRGSKVIFITSQGGSVAWRDTQCPDGGDYGHHMSKAAANMAGKLVANEFRKEGILVGIFHPGFNSTEMTEKYRHEFATHGTVDPSVGAQRICHETNLLTAETSGRFLNCVDGRDIPW